MNGNGNRPALTDARVAQLLELVSDPKCRRLFEAYRNVRASLAGGFTEPPDRVATAGVRTAVSFYGIGRPRSREELRATGRHPPVQLNTSTVKGTSDEPR